MVTAYDIPASDLIDRMSVELKALSEISPPDWAPFVKTGVHKELPPEDPDWWFVRSAAVLRKIYIKGPIGTRRLKAMYGGKKNRGVKQEKSRSGSGSIARTILQQLEKAKLVETVPNGRQVTARGMSFVDNVAKRALQ
jgi:small subunit ribosomal protein S19e